MKNKNKEKKDNKVTGSGEKISDQYSKAKKKQNFFNTFYKKHGLWIVLLFIVGIVFSWWFLCQYANAGIKLLEFYQGSYHSAVGQATSVVEEELSKNIARRIDGMIVEREQANLLPYAVMIENLRSVRPQNGLSQAAVVYETLAEGGSTRFMAIFDPSEVIPEIMPVRSARPYYLEWVSEYGAPYAHAGGSPKALTVIRENDDIIDLEALSSDAVYFWRDTSKYAPHNLVTSSEKMNFALRDKELDELKTEYRSWKFKDGAVLENRGEDSKTVVFNYSYGLTYKVGYKYNKEKNIYLRFNADEEHKDKNTDQQITVNNVIVQIVPEPVLEGGKGRLEIYVGGEGKAWIFVDGQAIEGIWKKGSRIERTLFYDADGNEIEFNRGNTWVNVISETQEVHYE